MRATRTASDACTATTTSYSRRQTSLGQQRDRVDDNRIRGRRGDPTLRFGPDQRVGDRLKTRALTRVGEDDGGESPPIEPAVARDHVRSEGRRHRVEARGPRQHHIAGDRIGVDADRA